MEAYSEIRREENKRLERAGLPMYFDDAGYARCRSCHGYWSDWKIVKGREVDCCNCGAYKKAPREHQLTY